MQGEINITEIMDRGQRLKAWHKRQQRDAEWAALNQWWKAEEKVNTAADELELLVALEFRTQTARLYQTELGRAWPKWRKVQQDRAACRSAQNRHRAAAGKPSIGLPNPTSSIG